MRDDDRDDDRYDDYEDRPGRDGPGFPTGVLAAGIIWIGFGVLGVVGTLFNLVTVGAQAAGGPQNPGAGAGGCCGGLVAIGFLVVGIQTVTGKAKDTSGNGLGSLGLAVLYGGVAIVVGAFGAAGALGPPPNNPPGPPNAGGLQADVWVVAAVLGFFALLLAVAGVLALSGRSAYRAWRRAEGLDRPRRRPPRDDEDDQGDDRHRQ